MPVAVVTKLDISAFQILAKAAEISSLNQTAIEASNFGRKVSGLALAFFAWGST